MANELPPGMGDAPNPHEPCGSDGACSIEEYQGWWSHGSKLQSFLTRIPEEASGRLGLDRLHKELLARWEAQIVSPDSISGRVTDETVGVINDWIRQAETLVYSVTYHEEGPSFPGATTPGHLTIVEAPQISSRWPWIEGWDDPRKRDVILAPQGGASSNGIGKKLLIGGAIAAGAYFMFKD